MAICGNCGEETGHRRHVKPHVCKRPVRIFCDERPPGYADAQYEASRGVQFSMCKGYVHPDETKEFRAVFKRLWNNEITREQFDQWVEAFNQRKQEQKEFRL